MNDFKLVGSMISASPINMKDYLKDGEIDVTYKKYEDIIKDIRDTILVKRLVVDGPIFLYIKNFKITAGEIGSLDFATRQEVDDYIKNHKRIIIYQLLHNIVLDKYKLRFSDLGFNILDWWLSRFRFRHYYRFNK
jgi:hypothetical protein